MTGIIIDDHKIIAESIKQSLLHQNFATEITVYTNPKDFFNNINEGKKLPHFIISDLLMPEMSGIELLKNYQELRTRFSKETNCKIIVLSSISDPLTVKMAIRNGVDAYLSKESTIEELIEGINEALDGKKYIAKNLQGKMLNNLFFEEQIVYHLTPREKEVLQYVCSGSTIKETAHKMFLSVHTVKGYHKNIMKKFNVNRTSDLIVFAMKNGFYNPKD